MIKRLPLLLLLASLSSLSFAQDKWQLIKDEDGIKVYSRRLENEKFKELRADFELKGTQDRLVSILKNIAHQKDWSYGTKRTSLIEKKSRDTLIYYSEISLPWPLSNRDLVIELTFKRDTAHKALFIQAQSLPGIIPVKPNLVRVPYSLATWDVRQQGNKLLKVQYFFKTNPGGTLPAWLVNLAASAGPYNSFHKLKELIQKENTD